MSTRPAVTTLRTLPDGDCDDEVTCVGRHQLDGVTGSFVVLKVVTDPAHAAALASHIGPGELLGWTPDALFDPYGV